jgi:uncharacterized protein YkwD
MKPRYYWGAILLLLTIWGATQTNGMVQAVGSTAGMALASSGEVMARWTRVPARTKTALPARTATKTGTPTSTAQRSPTPTISTVCPAFNQTFEARVLELINQERARQALPALKAQSQLAAAARAHSAEMACNNYFSHTGLNGSTVASRIGQQGYSWSRVGENIAGGSSTPEAVVQQWMNSAPHKANILSPNFTDVGVGYAYASTSTYKHYWTLDFARP